ncbi:hypothetical protein PM082_024559 [Marasmius tenuissimus]|nr:hypothetical protein PM082_002433 [Marasmius tenuissimus]KAJ8091290.1 hypothetical protein PM082_024559 [Marasmius tenuissimus]
MFAPTHAENLPCEIIREILNEFLIDTHFLVMVHTGEVTVVDHFTRSRLSQSEIETLCQVSRQWRAIVEDLRIWQRIDIDLHHDRMPLDGDGSLTPDDTQDLKRIIDVADERGRGLHITLNVWGRPLDVWGRPRISVHYPALEFLMTTSVGWGAFRFVAAAGVDLGLTCRFMDLVRAKLEQCRVLGVVINDNDLGGGGTTQDLIGRLQGMDELRHLRLSWLPLQGKRGWTWRSVKGLGVPVLLGIRRLEVACTPATALWLLSHCRNVERVSLSLEYEEKAFQREGETEADVELTMLEKLAISVPNTGVDLTFVTLLRRLVCVQLRTFSIRWFYRPVGKSHHFDAVNAFLERAGGGIDGRVYVPFAGADEKRCYAGLNMRLLSLPY